MVAVRFLCQVHLLSRLLAWLMVAMGRGNQALCNTAYITSTLIKLGTIKPREIIYIRIWLVVQFKYSF